MLLFDEICHLAKTKDTEALTRKINEEKICIDVRKGIYTPVALLAQQGEEEAVTLLIREFNANPNWAVFGYAAGGHTAQVEAAFGYAAGDYAAQVETLCVEKLLARYASQCLYWAVKGYAAGGHTAQVEALVAHDASRCLYWAVKGYAAGSHTAQVDELLARGTRPHWTVEDYAAGGYTTQVDALIHQGANDPYWVEDYAADNYIAQYRAQVLEPLGLGAYRDYAVLGYATGGHIAQVEALLARGADQDMAVKGYAKGGHIAQVEELLARSADLDYAVFGYAEGGHIAQVEALLARGADRDMAVKGYWEGGHTENSEKLLRLMTLTDHQSLRNVLYKKTFYYNSTDLLKKSDGLRRLMKKNHLSYSWSRVFTPALNFLFLQGHLLMQKGKITLGLLLKISSFISGFSEAESYTFLSRHYKSKSNKLKEGRDTYLFRRQASLVNTIAASDTLSSLTENECIERCKRFGEKHKQRWAKEPSSDLLLSHLYEALGERLKLYTEHYRMPALIAFYHDLAKKHPGNSQAVIDEIRRLDNPENDVARAERYIAIFRQKAEHRWEALKQNHGYYRRHSQVTGEPSQHQSSSGYKKLQNRLKKIKEKKKVLLEEKEAGNLTPEKLREIREKQVALSIGELEYQWSIMAVDIGEDLSLRVSPQLLSNKKRNIFSSAENLYMDTMESIRDFCKPENVFQANDLMRELERYSTVAEIAASDLYELEKAIKDKSYDHSTDYEFCLLPEEENMPCSLQRALKGIFLESSDINEQYSNDRNYQLWFSTLKANKIYIQIDNQPNAQDQSQRVINYFVKSRAGGILEGTLTREDVDRILNTHSDAATLAQHMHQGREEDLVNMLQAHITAFKNHIYKQLEKQEQELGKKKNGTMEEMKEYHAYERYRKHVGIYEQSAEKRNKMIQAGFEYVFDHVMRPIAEERARLLIECRKLSEALEKHKARLDEIRDNPSLSRQSCLSWSTEKDELTRKIQKLENSIELLKQKVDLLSGVLESNASGIKEAKKGKGFYGTPFSSIALPSYYTYLDSSYRQTRTEISEENNNRNREVDVSILNQARDYVTNFVRKLVGVVLIPLRAILGSCAPESLQKQAFYHTQSAHRLFKAKSDWEKYNEEPQKKFGLPLRDLAL